MNTLAWTHAVRDVPAGGLPVERQATPAELQALALALLIPSVEAVAAKYRLVPATGGRLRLQGTVRAQVTQECVVTLEPVPGTVVVDLDVVYCSEAGAATTGEDGLIGDLDAPDEEPIENGTVDIGRVVFEEIASGLDPYPRREGANFDWTDETAARAATHPFAALARLKKPDATS